MGLTLVVHEVYARPDGTLGVKAPAGVVAAFAHQERLTAAPITLTTQDSCADSYLARTTGDLSLQVCRPMSSLPPARGRLASACLKTKSRATPMNSSSTSVKTG